MPMNEIRDIVYKHYICVYVIDLGIVIQQKIK